MKLKIQNSFVIQLQTRYWQSTYKLCYNTPSVVSFGEFFGCLILWVDFFKSTFEPRSYKFLVNYNNMKWSIKFSQIISFLIHSHMHEANFPQKKISENITPQEVHDAWENGVWIYTSSGKWMVGRLAVNKFHWKKSPPHTCSACHVVGRTWLPVL